jgi:dihydroxy-acid dehydratase
MEDFHQAGGMTAVLRELRPSLHLDALTVTGRTLGEELDAAAPAFPQEIIQGRSRPIHAEGGIAVLRGNLAPDGAVLKPSAATPALMRHSGRAVVFEDIDDLNARIDDPALDVNPDDILVLKNCGPKGYPGFPEVGNFALPTKILKQGITDMIRISDARMSGTAYGTVVLHTAPEAAAGGPLALVKTGDRIELDVEQRSLRLMVSDAELASRRATRSPRARP